MGAIKTVQGRAWHILESDVALVCPNPSRAWMGYMKESRERCWGRGRAVGTEREESADTELLDEHLSKKGRLANFGQSG